jgi:two-component system chemotaxis response regulator CheB
VTPGTTIELVVIGGSAGALEPLLALVPLLPDLHVPIVVALHLGANQRNLLPDIIAAVTRRTVTEVEDKQPLEPDFIYIAPPNYHVLVERTGTLALSVDDAVNYSRPSIDVLFESAAAAFGSRCVGVLLSGANSGLARIVDAGGQALIQDPATAQHPTMPAAAVVRLGARGTALAVAALAKALASLATAPYGEVAP